mmetsp:Transcript_30226/g.40176  ORF Transcript_30226/g.40176 Transcript_30226/m.40176 type:complete len:346 (-) Transcript_30226:171-1208(-)
MLGAVEEGQKLELGAGLERLGWRVRSRVGAEPVAVNLVGLEHLLTELFVATRLDGVELESVRVGVHVVGLGEQVRDRVERAHDGEHEADDDLLIGSLVLAEVRDVLSDIVGHLGRGGRSAILVFDHAVMELRGHGDDHVIVVRVEVATLGDIETEGRRVVVAGQQVVGVVDETGLVSARLGQLGRPHAHVGVLGLMDGHVGWPDSVVDLALAVIPLLEEVASVFLMGGVHLRQIHHLLLELHLPETLVHEQIVLLVHGTVAALAGTGEDLEATTESGGVPGVPCHLRGEVGVTVVHADGVHLLFVTFDAMGRTDVVTEDPGLGRRLRASQAVNSAAGHHRVAQCR